MLFLFSDLMLYAYPRGKGGAPTGGSTQKEKESSSGAMFDFGALILLNEHARLVDVADTEGVSRSTCSRTYAHCAETDNQSSVSY